MSNVSGTTDSGGLGQVIEQAQYDQRGRIPGTSAPGGLSRIPFTAAAEAQITSLAFWLNVVGWLNVIAAVGDIISLFQPQRNVGQLFSLAIHAAIAGWSLQAAKAFKSVAMTDVADQEYLIQGFTKLRSIFLLQGILIIISLAFVVAVVLGLFFWVAVPRAH
jgi:hypothetical protein